jgi:oligoendopeptidase F
MAQDLPTRDQIADKYKWQLTDLYKTEADFDSDYVRIGKLADNFAVHKGKITTSAKDLLSALKDYYAIWQSYNRLAMYAMLLSDVDVSISKNQILESRAMALGSEIKAKTAFYSPELLAVPYSTIEKYIKENKDLQQYKFNLEQAFRMKPHTLSAETEEVIAKMGPVLQLPDKLFGILNDAELQLPYVKDTDGSDIQVSHGRYRAALYDTNRAYRQRIYMGMYEGYKKNINSFEGLYNGKVAERLALANIRKFNSPLEMATYENNIPTEVYTNLLKTAQDNVKTLHRWGEIKRKALGYDKIHPYDTYVTLFEEAPRTYTFEEGVNMVREALRPLGKEYIRAYDSAINNRWVDVFETKNKRSGAYSNASGCGVHPWILLNFSGTLDDVFTLAHEIGHTLHSFFTEAKQPFHYRDYSVFVAEVASTTNEALLLEYMLKNAETDTERLSLLEKFLINAQTTFFRQARFAEFEMMTHEKAAKGEYLSADELVSLFNERYQYYWGEAMITDWEEGLSFARVHHLTTYNFYVYQYSTGFAAAQALSEGIVTKGQPAVDDYFTFLSGGCSDTPINLLKTAGVDMSKPAPITATINKMERYMDEMEKLMNK